MRNRARVDLEGLRNRVQGLVDQHFGGSEKRAGKAWGVNQSTVNRFLSGKTSRPGVDFAQKIGRYHKVGLGWLIEGEGNAPALPEGPREEGDAWRRLVRSLALSSKTERAVLILPLTTNRAFGDLTYMRGLRSLLAEGSYNIAPAVARGAWHAARYEHLAWIHLLEGMLEAYGKDAVRSKLEAEWLALALGYQGLALNLYGAGKLSQDAIEAEFAEYAQPGLLKRRSYGEPTVPGLEAARVKSGAARARDE